MRLAMTAAFAALLAVGLLIPAGGRDAGLTTTAVAAKKKSAATPKATKAKVRKASRVKTAKVTPTAVPLGPPAKELFGAATSAAPLAARSIGFYARGCLSGAKPLAIDGPAWQAMRLSRNRMWGHPDLIAIVERLAKDAKAKDGWPGLLVGDISQPRGGPMLTGHASHQVGLDADVWLTPMPDRKLTKREREDLPATSMLGGDKLSVDPAIWTAKHGRLILRAASYSQVERVLVHPAIKKAICSDKSLPRTHLHKVRPYWGHHYHMHIRIGCPKGSTTCKAQPPTGNEDGCGKEVDDWLARMKKRLDAPKIVLPKVPPKPGPPPRQVMLSDLPAECKVVLEAGNAVQQAVPPPPAQPQPPVPMAKR